MTTFPRLSGVLLSSLLLLFPAEKPVFAWSHYGADAANTKFVPLGQIDSTNFSELRIIWRRPLPDAEILAAEGIESDSHRSTPIAVNGILYAISPLNIVSALHAETGTVLWTFDPQAWRLDSFFRGFHRGVSHWSDGDQERIFFGTFSAYLYALDAKTGQPDLQFGEGGRIDLTQGLGRLVERDTYAFISPPIICRDVVVVGSSIIDWRAGRDLPASTPPGDVRGFDVRTGELLWTFHAIPHPGEFGHDTWEPDAWKEFGAANVWSMMSADRDLGYVYLPFSTPSNDFYGGDRPGDNLFGESLVCLDARTGKRVWHQQLVHHGLWDYDLPAAPILLDIEVESEPIRAVAQVTKQGFCFVFDRVTGEPVWPIEELPVPPSTVPGERASSTQPFPTRPAAFDRQGLRVDDLIDFTPQLRASALEIVARYDYGPLFTPPSEKGTILLPGTLGGADWAGAAVHPGKGVIYVPSHTTARSVQLRRTAETDPHFPYAARVRNRVRGPQGLPLTKPPYGRLTAIDLNTGEHLWMRPTGLGPVHHPALRHLDLPPLGWQSRVFPVVTPTLLLAAPEPTRRDYWEYYANPEAYLWAFDLDDGHLVGRTPLPRNARGNPMTYAAGGRQYVVVPVGWGQSAELVALAVPRAGEELPPQLVDRTDADHPSFYRAVDALDNGDVATLQKMLAADPALVAARGYLDEYYGDGYFRGATLLHHVAGNPMRAKLPANILVIARLLLEAGSDPDALTLDSTSTLGLVISGAQPRWEGVKEELIELLLETGADPDRDRGEPLYAALTNAREPHIARLFYERGATVDLRFAAGLDLTEEMERFFTAGGLAPDALSRYRPAADSARPTDQEILDEALAYAAYRGSRAAAILLLERGAEIDSQPSNFFGPNDPGSTALHKAVSGEQADMVRFLLEQGADPSIRDLDHDSTPLGWADYFGHDEITRLLRQWEEETQPGEPQ